MATFDCDAAMTDTQVMEFCRQGFLVLEGIVPPEIDHKTLESLDAFYATQPEDLPDRNLPGTYSAAKFFKISLSEFLPLFLPIVTMDESLRRLSCTKGMLAGSFRLH